MLPHLVLPNISGACFRDKSMFIACTFEYEKDGFGGKDGAGDSGEDPSSAPEVDIEDVPDITRGDAKFIITWMWC